jgi:hypothetical protein
MITQVASVETRSGGEPVEYSIENLFHTGDKYEVIWSW